MKLEHSPFLVRNAVVSQAINGGSKPNSFRQGASPELLVEAPQVIMLVLDKACESSRTASRFGSVLTSHGVKEHGLLHNVTECFQGERLREDASKAFSLKFC